MFTWKICEVLGEIRTATASSCRRHMTFLIAHSCNLLGRLRSKSGISLEQGSSTDFMPKRMRHSTMATKAANIPACQWKAWSVKSFWDCHPLDPKSWTEHVTHSLSLHTLVSPGYTLTVARMLLTQVLGPARIPHKAVRVSFACMTGWSKSTQEKRNAIGQFFKHIMTLLLGWTLPVDFYVGLWGKDSSKLMRFLNNNWCFFHW